MNNPTYVSDLEKQNEQLQQKLAEAEARLKTAEELNTDWQITFKSVLAQMTMKVKPSKHTIGGDVHYADFTYEFSSDASYFTVSGKEMQKMMEKKYNDGIISMAEIKRSLEQVMNVDKFNTIQRKYP
jgi:hypothetical protein